MEKELLLIQATSNKAERGTANEPVVGMNTEKQIRNIS